MSSTPEIVKLLVDAGARLVARIADGRTALHLAAERGDVQAVKILMDKSLEHEAEEDEKQEQKRKAKGAATGASDGPAVREDKDSSAEDSDGELVDAEDSVVEGQSMVTGSFVKLDKNEKPSAPDDMVPDDAEDDPDFYDVNVISWDAPGSALHLAIVAGHEEVVKLLCQEYGADVLLPLKNLDAGGSVVSVLLTLVLALALPIERASSMAKVLLTLGATSAQADNNGVTAFHSYVKSKAEALVQVLWENDKTGSKAAINHIAFTDQTKSETPLQAAARNGDLALVLKLLDNGALAEIDFETWLKSAKQQIEGQLQGFDENMVQFRATTEQPLACALKSSNPSVALQLINRGVDVNILTLATYDQLQRLEKGWYVSGPGMSALDLVRSQLKRLRAHKLGPDLLRPRLPKGMDEYLVKFKEGSYQHWVVARAIKGQHRAFARFVKADQEKQSRFDSTLGIQEKEEAIRDLIRTLEELEKVLVEKGAKTFEELYPEEHKKFNKNSHGRAVDEAEDKEDKEVTFDYTFNFNNVTDVTTARKAAYLDL
jgi:ankyrin repeat protein